MNSKTIKSLLALTLMLSALTPVNARGFGGGFGGFHGGGGFDHGFGGGGFDRGGFDHGGFDHGGFDHGFGGGGFDRASFDQGFDRGAFPAGGFDHATLSPGGGFAGHPNLGADGGFGGAASASKYSSAHLNNFDENHMNLQGNEVGNSFSHNTVNNFNSYGHNNIANGYHPDGYGGYHPYGGYGYHGGAYGYHGYGAYGWHGGYGAYGWHGGIYGYPGGWYNPGFMEASMWTFMGVSTLTDFLGIEALSSAANKNQKTTTNITYQGDNVYINGTPANQYYNQAQQLAATANPQLSMTQNLPTNVQAGLGANLPSSDVAANVPAGVAANLPPNLGAKLANLPPNILEKLQAAGINPQQLANLAHSPAASGTTSTTAVAVEEKWEPLGVYSLVEPGQKDSTTLFQLAINKDGIVRGNYMNQITNEKAQVQGALDKKTGQISWYVGSNPTTMFETNLSEIAKKNSKIVVQFGADSTQQMALIRLPAPKPGEGKEQVEGQPQPASGS